MDALTSAVMLHIARVILPCMACPRFMSPAQATALRCAMRHELKERATTLTAGANRSTQTLTPLPLYLSLSLTPSLSLCVSQRTAATRASASRRG